LIFSDDIFIIDIIFSLAFFIDCHYCFDCFLSLPADAHFITIADIATLIFIIFFHFDLFLYFRYCTLAESRGFFLHFHFSSPFLLRAL
jgi:hypothetical protein